MIPALAAYLDAVQARCDAAKAELFGLCNGSRKWTMRIPVDENDSDRVLVKPIGYDLPILVQLVQELAEWIAGEHEPDHTEYVALDCVVCEILARADALIPKAPDE